MLKISADDTRALISGITGPNSRKIVRGGIEFGQNAMVELRKYEKNLGFLAPNDMFEKANKVKKIVPDITELKQENSLNKNTIDSIGILDISRYDDLSKKLNKFLETLMPANFTVKYMPKNKLDMQALMGAAYERLGNALSRPVESFKLPDFVPGATRKAFVNEKGKIDLENEAVAILMKDMASKHTEPIEEIFNKGLNLNPKDVTGRITEIGQRNFDFTYLDPRNIENTKEMVKQIFDYFNIGKAVDQFKQLISK